MPKDVDLKGMNVVVSGRIPPNAGLSSSSALVSAAALATAHAHDVSYKTRVFFLLFAKGSRQYTLNKIVKINLKSQNIQREFESLYPLKKNKTFDNFI